MTLPGIVRVPEASIIKSIAADSSDAIGDCQDAVHAVTVIECSGFNGCDAVGNCYCATQTTRSKCAAANANDAVRNGHACQALDRGKCHIANGGDAIVNH